MLSRLGWDVTCVDISQGGVVIARKSDVKAEVGDTYDDLKSCYGTFPNGYAKNLALAVCGKLDLHFRAR
jgi:hypothetical protein